MIETKEVVEHGLIQKIKEHNMNLLSVSEYYSKSKAIDKTEIKKGKQADLLAGATLGLAMLWRQENGRKFRR